MQNDEKKLVIKRLAIFVLFAFVPCYIIAFIGSSVCDSVTDPAYSIFTFLMMFTPAAATFITRRLTKEGMAESYLRINFKGHERFYILAFVIPLGYWLLGQLFTHWFMGADFRLAENLAQMKVSPVIYGSSFFMGISASFFLLPVYLGEELGWRGYMFPKLIKLMNRPLAYIVGGIIWAVWHAPAIAFGFNFGTDYKGYPWTGILMMCVFCIAVGIILSWLVDKTGSVYPAAICHAVNNSTSSAFSLMTSNEDAPVNSIAVFAVLSAAIFIFAAACIAESVISSKNAAKSANTAKTAA